MRNLIAAALAALTCAAAEGQAAPGLPALVEAAFSAGTETPEDAYWQFTLTADMGERGRFVARFDGARPEAERWALIDPPSPDAMSDGLRTAWENMSTRDGDGGSAPDGERRGLGLGGGSGLFFGPESVGFVAGGVREIRSTPNQVTFAFDPDLAGDGDDDGVGRAMGEHLAGEMTINRTDPFVERLRIHAPGAFRPNLMVRISAFEMELEFERREDLPAPILTRFLTHVEASALMQRVTQRMEFRFSDIAYHSQ